MSIEAAPTHWTSFPLAVFVRRVVVARPFAGPGRLTRLGLPGSAALGVHQFVEDQEQLVRVDRAGVEVVVAVLAVVEVEAAQLSEAGQAGDDLLDVHVRRMVAEVDQAAGLFAQFLRERSSVGDLRPEIDVEAAAAIFLASLTGILLMHELFGGKDVEVLDDERVLNRMCDLFLKGVATA